jgi:hypothetical protein
MEMAEVVTALKDTPLPTILVAGGMVLLLLSVGGKIGKIRISKDGQKRATVIGSVLTLLGIALYIAPFLPGWPSATETPTAAATAAPTTMAIAEATAIPTSTTPATAAPTSSPTPAPPATSAPATEAPAVPTPCGLSVNSQFAAVWDRDTLGCPTEPAKRGVQLAEEPFERGYMLWRQDLGHIYVLHSDDATWQEFEDTWEEGQPVYACPELAPSETPPTPCRGFGRVWCLQSGVKDRIGKGEERESGYTGVIQAFQYGLMVTSSENGVYILLDNGSWEGL